MRTGAESFRAEGDFHVGAFPIANRDVRGDAKARVS
jgi:hypothetical protein